MPPSAGPAVPGLLIAPVNAPFLATEQLAFQQRFRTRAGLMGHKRTARAQTFGVNEAQTGSCRCPFPR